MAGRTMAVLILRQARVVYLGVAIHLQSRRARDLADDTGVAIDCINYKPRMSASESASSNLIWPDKMLTLWECLEGATQSFAICDNDS